jgi:hypothetical protein
VAQTNTFARSLQELGLAAWFGGSLVDAVRAELGTEQVDHENPLAPLAFAGWRNSWTFMNLGAVGACLAGTVFVMAGNKGRLIGQQHVATTGAVKIAVIGAALTATARTRSVGRRLLEAGERSLSEGTEITPETSPVVEGARRRLRILMWSVPALTGVLVVLNAFMGELQRPSQVAFGLLRRVTPKGFSR